jgi:hypothetical protein
MITKLPNILLLRYHYRVVEVWGPFLTEEKALDKMAEVLQARPSLSEREFATKSIDHLEGAPEQLPSGYVRKDFFGELPEGMVLGVKATFTYRRAGDLKDELELRFDSEAAAQQVGLDSHFKATGWRIGENGKIILIVQRVKKGGDKITKLAKGGKWKYRLHIYLRNLSAAAPCRFPGETPVILCVKKDKRIHLEFMDPRK